MPTTRCAGPDVWTGAELAAQPASWRWQLTAAQLGDLDAAADRLIARGWPAVDPVGSPDAPSPSLAG